MIDQRLRELERAWRASCSPDDEVAYLRERVRLGSLSRERLQAAAALGHAPSRLILAEPVSDDRWDEPFRYLEPVTMVRAYLAALELTIRAGRVPRRNSHGLTAIAREIREWCCRPSHLIRDHVLQSIAAFCGEPWPTSTRHMVHLAHLLLVHIALIVTHQEPTATSTEIVYFSDPEALHACLFSSDGRAAVSKDVVPWLLGYGDPLLERHAGPS